MRLMPPGRAKPETILDGQTTAVVCLDEDLRVTSLNSAAEGLFAIGRRHAMGQPIEAAIPHFAPHRERLQQALDAGTGFIEREMALSRNGEEPLTVDSTVTPFLNGK